jgi:hypothetical protein
MWVMGDTYRSEKVQKLIEGLEEMKEVMIRISGKSVPLYVHRSSCHTLQ